MQQIRILRITCAAIIIVSFFLPWVSLFGFSLPGYKIAEIAGGFSNILKSLGSPGSRDNMLLLFPYIIPILSLLAILTELASSSTTQRSNLVAFFAGISPLVLLVYGISKIGNDLFQVLSIGSYLTIISAIVLIIVAVKSFDNVPIKITEKTASEFLTSKTDDLKCNNCGEKLPGDSMFCMNCGQPTKVVEGKIICKSCNTELTLDSKFCWECGAPI